MPTLAERLNRKHPEYARLEALRKPCRHLFAGLPTLLEHATEYLPREPMEKQVSVPDFGIIDEWELRKRRARLHNLFRDGVQMLTSKPFTKKAQVSADAPESLGGSETSMGFQDDVDGGGTNLHVFALRRCRNSVAEGLDGVLVDYPTTENVGQRSKAEERTLGLRPTWRPYCAESILDWRWEVVAGRRRLSYLKLADTWTDPSTGESLPSRREFWAAGATGNEGAKFTRFEVYHQTEKGKEESWSIASVGFRTPHVDIPFVPLSTDAEDPMAAEPSLADAAHQNLAHFRKTSDLDTSQHAVGAVLLYWSGTSLEDAKAQMAGGVNSLRFFVCQHPGGVVGFAEPSGASWSALEKTLGNLERQIKDALNEPLFRDSAQPVTAEEAGIDAGKHSSQLESWVQQWEDALNTLLYYTAIDYGDIVPSAKTGWGSVQLNHSFVASSKDMERSRHAWELVDRGVLSEESAFRVSQECKAIPDDTTYEAEQEAVAEAGPRGKVPPDDGDDLTKPEEAPQIA